MIKIHFDNKDVVEVETTIENYIEVITELNKLKETNAKYNTIIFNNQVVVNFDKIVYVEKIEVEQ